MSLAYLVRSIEVDLARNLPRNTLAFPEARARRPELASFDTLTDLRRALDAGSPLPINARRALVTALVEESQRNTSSVWSSLLVVAFAPMLHGLRARTGGLGDRDLDSAILAAFLVAIHAIRPSPFTSLALRWMTEKEVTRARRAERRLDARTAFDEDIHSQTVFRASNRDDALDDVLRVLAMDGQAEILDVLIATRGRDESLRAYVVRTCANPRERGARYEHLCRARLRFERELRERLAARAA